MFSLLLNLSQNDFNYDTQTGITTVADFNIVGDLTTAVPQDINLNAQSGVSTFFKLDVTSSMRVGTALTVQDFQCNVTATGDAGISTFGTLDVNGAVDVAERLIVGSAPASKIYLLVVLQH